MVTNSVPWYPPLRAYPDRVSKSPKFVFKSSLVVLIMLVLALSGYAHLNVHTVNAQAATGSPQYVYYNNSDTKLDGLYRAQSVMLSNPEINAWLTHNHINKSLLLPYVTMIPVGGNPYDYSQGSVTINSTTYAIYSYELPNGTVISFWVLGNNILKVYTYQSTPNVVFSTGENAYVENAAGHQVEGSTSPYSNQILNGATYESVVFGDLSSPPGCSTNVCWEYGNWLGVSNYDWTGQLPSNPYFLQGIIAYWGGHATAPNYCNGFQHNCLVFMFADDSPSLEPYATGIGDLASGSQLNFYWLTPGANCMPPTNGVEDWVVVLQISDSSAGVSTEYRMCFPVSNYVQFLEERPLITTSSGNIIFENPQFGKHSFTAWAYDASGTQRPLNYFLVTWRIDMINCYGNYLVTSTDLSNYASYSTWSNSWVASSTC